jgi:hypothetical protein
MKGLGKLICEPGHHDQSLCFTLLTTSRFAFKKFQADNVMKIMNSPEVEHFKKDKDAAKTPVKKYGTGDERGQAPKQSF